MSAGQADNSASASDNATDQPTTPTTGVSADSHEAPDEELTTSPPEEVFTGSPIEEEPIFGSRSSGASPSTPAVAVCLSDTYDPQETLVSIFTTYRDFIPADLPPAFQCNTPVSSIDELNSYMIRLAIEDSRKSTERWRSMELRDEEQEWIMSGYVEYSSKKEKRYFDHIFWNEELPEGDFDECCGHQSPREEVEEDVNDEELWEEGLPPADWSAIYDEED